VSADARCLATVGRSIKFMLPVCGSGLARRTARIVIVREPFSWGWCGVVHVFISHSTLDRAIAGEVSSSLWAAGREPFLDHDFRDGIGVSEDWRRRLYRELREDGVGTSVAVRNEGKITKMPCFKDRER
jgi:hypothetical protein